MNLEKIYKEYVPLSIRDNTYIVGGFVRDHIIGIENNDIDFVVEGLNESDMLNLGFKRVGKSFPVFLGKDNTEFALCRTERKNGLGYNGFSTEIEGVSLYEDLKRRDFTMNAIAVDINGVMIDPFNGISDIKNKIIREVSEDHFSEDPLRILRLARFLTKYKFDMSNSLFALIDNAKADLENISRNRICLELDKILKLDNASDYFRHLDKLNVLDIIYPDLYKMKFCEQKKENHAEGNVFNHSLMVLDKACKLTKDSDIRFCALFHDLGKIHTYNKHELTYYKHYSSSLAEEILSDFNTRYTFTKRRMRLLFISITFHHLLYFKYKTNGVIKIIYRDKFCKTKEEFETLRVVIKADSSGRLIVKDNKIIESEEVDTSLIDLVEYITNIKLTKKDFIDNILNTQEKIRNFLRKKRLIALKSKLLEN